MTESVPGSVLRQLTKSLEAVEWQLGSEPVPRDALEDFKMAVDHIRLSTWALLEADSAKIGSGGQRTVIAQFRLARANELLRHLQEDFEAGAISPDAEELWQLQHRLRDLAELISGYMGHHV